MADGVRSYFSICCELITPEALKARRLVERMARRVKSAGTLRFLTTPTGSRSTEDAAVRELRIAVACACSRTNDGDHLARRKYTCERSLTGIQPANNAVEQIVWPPQVNDGRTSILDSVDRSADEERSSPDLVIRCDLVAAVVEAHQRECVDLERGFVGRLDGGRRLDEGGRLDGGGVDFVVRRPNICGVDFVVRRPNIYCIGFRFKQLATSEHSARDAHHDGGNSQDRVVLPE